MGLGKQNARDHLAVPIVSLQINWSFESRGTQNASDLVDVSQWRGARSEKKRLVSSGTQIAFMISSNFKICDIQGTVVGLNELFHLN